MMRILGYAIFSQVTNKFLVRDYVSGGYCSQSDSPFVQNGMAQGIWTCESDANAYARSWDGNSGHLPHAETYKAVPVGIE